MRTAAGWGKEDTCHYSTFVLFKGCQGVDRAELSIRRDLNINSNDAADNIFFFWVSRPPQSLAGFSAVDFRAALFLAYYSLFCKYCLALDDSRADKTLKVLKTFRVKRIYLGKSK